MSVNTSDSNNAKCGSGCSDSSSENNDYKDYDLCGISHETQFSFSLRSPYCPKVGLCGHSFCDKSLKDWWKVRSKDSNNSTTILPCPYYCSKIIKGGGNGTTTIPQEIPAFRTDKLVPNRSLCQAIQVIQHHEQKQGGGSSSSKKKKDTPTQIKLAATFDQCPMCHEKFSTELARSPSSSKSNKKGTEKNKKDQHSNQNRTPMVGMCGHTICLTCLQSITTTKSKRRAIKTISCPIPTCKQSKAFCCDQLVENINFGKALRHWKTLVTKMEQQKKKEEEEAEAKLKTTKAASMKPPGASAASIKKTKKTAGAQEKAQASKKKPTGATTTTTTKKGSPAANKKKPAATSNRKATRAASKDTTTYSKQEKSENSSSPCTVGTRKRTTRNSTAAAAAAAEMAGTTGNGGDGSESYRRPNKRARTCRGSSSK